MTFCEPVQHLCLKDVASSPKTNFLNFPHLFNVGLTHITPVLHNTVILLVAKPSTPSSLPKCPLEKNYKIKSLFSLFELCVTHFNFQQSRSFYTIHVDGVTLPFMWMA